MTDDNVTPLRGVIPLTSSRALDGDGYDGAVCVCGCAWFHIYVPAGTPPDGGEASPLRWPSVFALDRQGRVTARTGVPHCVACDTPLPEPTPTPGAGT